MKLMTEISVGEFLDKITILEIKSERIHDPAKLENVRRELDILRDIWAEAGIDYPGLAEHTAELKAINEKIWDIEDGIRDKERAQAFDAEFIELARAVYFTNDRRAAVKRDINLAAGSSLIEEKSYSDYGSGKPAPV